MRGLTKDTECLPVAGVHVGGGELLEHGAAVDVSLTVQHGVAGPVLNIEDHPDLLIGFLIKHSIFCISTL